MRGLTFHSVLKWAMFVFWILPVSAYAGAWPQARGEGFASSAFRIATEPGSGFISQYSTIYLEYGLGKSLTMGLDIGHSVSGAHKVVAFARIPMRFSHPKTRVALELGLGRINGREVLRPGLSFGRGFSFSKSRSGWLSMDAQAEIDLATRKTDFKADFTFGINHIGGRKTMLQIQTGQPYGRQGFVRLAPSIAIPVGKKRHVEIGVTYGLKGDNQIGLKLGFWQKF